MTVVMDVSLYFLGYFTCRRLGVIAVLGEGLVPFRFGINFEAAHHFPEYSAPNLSDTENLSESFVMVKLLLLPALLPFHSDAEMQQDVSRNSPMSRLRSSKTVSRVQWQL